MTTVQQRARQERAHVRLLNRIAFWRTALEEETTEVDGKPVDPAVKLRTAESELTNLNRALGIRS